MQTVAAFTDTYLQTVNGVSYTVRTWRDRWIARGGTMSVVYPQSERLEATVDEHPVSSISFPFYPGFRLAVPRIPPTLERTDFDVVHAHTPFALGLAARRFADRGNRPFVASYHTPTREYAPYLSEAFSSAIVHAADRYERWFYSGADAVIVPSESARTQLSVRDTPTHVVSNGVDLELFAPPDESTLSAFRDRHGIPDGPLVGYTGRHGHEKQLGELLSATVGLDVTLLLAGDGPARPELERRAAARDDVVFLGFLDRAELPAFYAILDVFGFPSPVETQGLVALESMACGTPVVGVDAGALSETIVDGETGLLYEPGAVDQFRAKIRRTIADGDTLSEACLRRRPSLDVERSIDALADVYRRVSTDGRRYCR